MISDPDDPEVRWIGATEAFEIIFIITLLLTGAML